MSIAAKTRAAEIKVQWAKEIEDAGKIGFMKPQLAAAWFLSKEEKAGTNAPYYARLSANGYLDCTDWTPLRCATDVRSWFSLFVDQD